MHFFPSNPEMATPNLNRCLMLRRNVRIQSSKLPPDFFPQNIHSRYGLSPFSSKELDSYSIHRDIKTPSFDCRNIVNNTI